MHPSRPLIKRPWRSSSTQILSRIEVKMKRWWVVEILNYYAIRSKDLSLRAMRLSLKRLILWPWRISTRWMKQSMDSRRKEWIGWLVKDILMDWLASTTQNTPRQAFTSHMNRIFGFDNNRMAIKHFYSTVNGSQRREACHL